MVAEPCEGSNPSPGIMNVAKRLILICCGLVAFVTLMFVISQC